MFSERDGHLKLLVHMRTEGGHLPHPFQLQGAGICGSRRENKPWKIWWNKIILIRSILYLNRLELAAIGSAVWTWNLMSFSGIKMFLEGVICKTKSEIAINKASYYLFSMENGGMNPWQVSFSDAKKSHVCIQIQCYFITSWGIDNNLPMLLFIDSMILVSVSVSWTGMSTSWCVAKVSQNLLIDFLWCIYLLLSVSFLNIWIGNSCVVGHRDARLLSLVSY